MNDVAITSNEIIDLPVKQPTFERVRSDSNQLWKKIYKSDFFRYAFQAAVEMVAIITFVAIVLPKCLLLGAISLVGLITLGLFSPALLHPKSAEVWKTVNNKILGLLTDLMYLPNAVLITPLAFKANVSMQKEESNQEKSAKPLVVLVHGFLHNKTCWESLTHRLCRNTNMTEKDIYAINLGEPLTLQEIDHYARFLATKLEKIRVKRKLEKMDVILDCHSMGGLVAGRFATKYASMIGVNIIRLISNGTPWHGTPMAYIGSLTSCGKEMLPNDKFQIKLTRKMKVMKDRIYTIASKGDTIVPYHSAIGSELGIDKDHQLTLDIPFGHLAMQHSEQSQKKNVQLILDAFDPLHHFDPKSL